MNDEDLAYVWKKLKYEFVPEGFDVISYGDMGDKFYITLHGSLGVYYPVKRLSEGNDKELDIDPDIWTFIRKKLICQEKEKFELPTRRQLNRRRLGQLLTDFKVDKESTSIIQKQIQLLKDQFQEVAILPNEWSFGELALISEQPRASTIRAKTDSHFAVLEKEDFN